MASTLHAPTDRAAGQRRAYATAYARRRRRLLAFGRWSPLVLVDPQPARDHLARLRQFGVSLEAIIEMSGQSMSLLAALVYPAHQRWGARITRESLQRILEVKFDLDAMPAHRRIDSAGTTRRLQGLAVMGWPLSSLADVLEVSVQAVASYRTRPTSTVRTARAVRDLYDRWSLLPGPSVRTTLAAQRAGWVSPLAWDDDSIDDPRAVPHPSVGDSTGSAAALPESGVVLDEIAIDRAMHGDPVALSAIERRTAALTLARQGLNDPDIAARLRVSPRTVMRWRHATLCAADRESA